VPKSATHRAALGARASMVVIHADCDCFFVQVHRRLDPCLAQAPLVVQQHNDTIACSFEARALGLQKRMRPGEIRRLHPGFPLLPEPMRWIAILAARKASYQKYLEESQQIFGLIRSHIQASCPFEVASNDEAFFVPSASDLSSQSGGQSDELEDAKQLALKLQAVVRRDLGYDVSFGCGANKLLAKLASTSAKPFGVGTLRADDPAFERIPLMRLPGCGMGSNTFAAVMGALQRAATAAPPTLGEVRSVLGAPALRQLLGPGLEAMSRGVDERAVAPWSAPRSVAVQMHLSGSKLEAMGMAARRRARGDVGRSPQYYYPLVPGHGGQFQAVSRAYLKLLARELLQRLESHHRLWHERPTSLVVSWELMGPPITRRSASVQLPPLSDQPTSAATSLVDLAMKVVASKLLLTKAQAGGTDATSSPVIMLGLQATAFQREVKTLRSFFSAAPHAASANNDAPAAKRAREAPKGPSVDTAAFPVTSGSAPPAHSTGDRLLPTGVATPENSSAGSLGPIFEVDVVDLLSDED